MKSSADSGATIHCFGNKNAFVPGSLESFEELTIIVADKTSIESSHWGEVIIPLLNSNLRLRQVLFVPSMGYNLVSTGQLADNGIESIFRRHDIILQLESNSQCIGGGNINLGTQLYTLPSESMNEYMFTSISDSPKCDTDNVELWHRRLAHISSQALLVIYKHANGVPRLTAMSGPCRACRMGKACKLPFQSRFREQVTSEKLFPRILWANSRCPFLIVTVTYALSAMTTLGTHFFVFFGNGVNWLMHFS